MAPSILDPGPAESEPTTQNSRWTEFKRASLQPFRGRGRGFWLGMPVTFLLMMLFEEATDTTIIGRSGAFLVLAGGAVGEWIGSRLATFRDELTLDDRRRRKVTRRVMLSVGTLLFIVNILPEYRQNFTTAGGGYYWSTESSSFAAIGAVLVLLAFLSKRSDEDF